MAKALKAKDVREKSEGDLQTELVEIQKQIFTLRTQAVTQKLEDSSRIGKLRKDIARIHTVLTEKKKASQPVKAAPAKAEKPAKTAKAPKTAKASK